MLPKLSTFQSRCYRFLPGLDREAGICDHCHLRHTVWLILLSAPWSAHHDHPQGSGRCLHRLRSHRRGFSSWKFRKSQTEKKTLEKVMDQNCCQGLVEFDDVHFTYPTRDVPILKGLSIRAEPGETIGLVGPSGCGKSTAVGP